MHANIIPEQKHALMIHSARIQSQAVLVSLTCLMGHSAGPLFAVTTAEDILKAVEGKEDLIVVVCCSNATTTEVVANLRSGDSLVDAIAGGAEELPESTRRSPEQELRGA